MKLISLRTAILSIIFSSIFSLAGHAQSLTIQACTSCHGASGQGFTSAPRLAGQRRQYIENQLVNFKNHTRDNPNSKQFMWGIASNLNPQMTRDLAIYFSTLPPKAANDGDKKFVASGRKIFQDGVPNSNIVACAACHGPNAEGIAEIPRLGGLSYAYLKQRLAQWSEGYHPTTKAPMPKISGALSQNQIEALASYLSFVK
jgi:cytochrome c553